MNFDKSAAVKAKANNMTDFNLFGYIADTLQKYVKWSINFLIRLEILLLSYF